MAIFQYFFILRRYSSIRNHINIFQNFLLKKCLKTYFPTGVPSQGRVDLVDFKNFIVKGASAARTSNAVFNKDYACVQTGASFVGKGSTVSAAEGISSFHHFLIFTFWLDSDNYAYADYPERDDGELSLLSKCLNDQLLL